MLGLEFPCFIKNQSSDSQHHRAAVHSSVLIDGRSLNKLLQGQFQVHFYTIDILLTGFNSGHGKLMQMSTRCFTMCFECTELLHNSGFYSLKKISLKSHHLYNTAA